MEYHITEESKPLSLSVQHIKHVLNSPPPLLQRQENTSQASMQPRCYYFDGTLCTTVNKTGDGCWHEAIFLLTKFDWFFYVERWGVRYDSQHTQCPMTTEWTWNNKLYILDKREPRPVTTATISGKIIFLWDNH